MKPLNIGIIGGSEGNGHPYSWSAIFNGYNERAMQLCEYPVIPEYLSEQNWPQAQIPNAQVTHIWMPDKQDALKIAKASNIEHVESDFIAMLDKVDAILLARDDAENHMHFAKPFIEKGLPIYIDKPIALSIKAMNELYQLTHYPGQIFTCSALRFSKDLRPSDEQLENIGDIIEVHAYTPKSWDKYAIHIIEPVLSLLNIDDNMVNLETSGLNKEARAVNVFWHSGVITRFFALGNNAASPLGLKIIGSKSTLDLQFGDTFQSFKSALLSFVEGAREQKDNSPKAYNHSIIEIIERGRSAS
ncbi:MAG: Gfo/Idh/MocA family oxidoreductase [Pseudomonadales bacterium]|nr:Gfo/Idh/MocA family oxidoreductase [Pseudomonadales bacterium]